MNDNLRGHPVTKFTGPIMDTVTVFGADAEEGHSVAVALLQDGTFKVRAVVQELGSPLAQRLQVSGAETVSVEFNNSTSIQEALKGAVKCFAVTSTDFTAADPLQCEIQQGYKMADACKQHNINHLVFRGSHHVHRRYGLPARHMDAKACINDYMNEIGLPKTELIAPFYYEHLLTSFKPAQTGIDCYKIAIPMGETAMDSISIKQVGPIVTAILKHSHNWIRKSCLLSADKMRIDEYAAILTKHLHPKQFKDSRISVKTFVADYKGPGGQDFGNMFEFWKKGAQKMNGAITSSLCPEIQSFSEWVSENREFIISTLEKESGAS
ncbi:nmrA-like family domain-containing protein 1 [Polyodon spathula]|uniref:nmrA-like family domain-containing protein 1 n=1 Tax=Polyodon spathula TaxID=7913 RepID=UPI001B7F4293|nr:nmrA-like family domain-containing protein 1 [Polyodon spathula]